jgi:hypothetical protein
MKSPRLTPRDVERDWPASGIAVAESTSIGVTVTSDRNPNSFAALEQTKRGLNGDRIFGIGVILRCDPVLAAPLRSLNGGGIITMSVDIERRAFAYESHQRSSSC